MRFANSPVLLIALGVAFASAPAWATPIDRDFGAGDFEQLAARDGSSGEMRVFGDPRAQGAALALVWPDNAAQRFAGDTLDRPARADAASGFARMLAADLGTLGPGSDPRVRGNPYLALGTWGGDGRAILHSIAVSDTGHVPADYGVGLGRAVESSFDGFYVRGGDRADDGDGPAPFDGEAMFSPAGLPLPLATSGGPGTGDGSSLAGDPGTGDPGSGNPGTGGSPGGGSSGNGDHDGNGHGGDRDGDGPGGHGGDGHGSGSGSGGGDRDGHDGHHGGNGDGNGNPNPVPEPGTLGLLILAFVAVAAVRNMRGLRATALALVALLPGAAFAASPGATGMDDWERLCNGAGGVTPELIIEGCSAVIGSEGENLGNVAIAYNNRGNALRAQEKFAEAKLDYDNSISLAPGDPFPWRNRGLVRGLMGQYDLALVDFNQAIRLKPDYASAFLGRAFAEQQLGQADKAQEDFAKAAKLDPKLASVIPAE